ncbi:MAG: rod shape-determining protein RodA [Deltaproteobacteria bacterium RIFCSPLOWO2_01_44_7]|nr:MAG: rod shape-determining protein RodA [Deltaproteobacteria bacterium RIFCSPHIGHO2_01_FULL_43_49]OGQ14237.1 MAG: rod shape-determining protein RodA [Deltaproteobacteria bacterium RIFCSPHIGHO2_02_FULL_44_53]OGQ27453.1 MAG: rod shape-determining protein RodA [Deltaproteobacteria bacterium RIFCSPHIGHO2_12_FULL_44_21]OGQ30701.1 MAG: rod shape-determining protein RodA [Deltaproteobacteria bacterium RIFCSPLOWO2_01_FULL_45_74]OGQ41429.1 MAG: rod shape-determining protein RodA [Deltaproteobacteria 
MKKNLFENFHWPLLWVVLSLAVLGLLNLYSALGVWGEGGQVDLIWHQLAWVSVGFILLLLLVNMDYRLWEKLGIYFYVGCIVALILVLLIGKVVSGHRSWLTVGPFYVQPSEFAKLGLIFILAKYFGDNPLPQGHGFRDLIKPLLLTIIPFVLILMEKDLGSSLFFPLIFITMAFVAKIKKGTIFLFLALVVIGGGLAYQYGLKPYQKERIRIFLNPESDPRKSGYHLIQSKIAVGSGKIFGKGYLKGKINKLRYLPDKHTDFIFPVLAEEWGLVGSFTILGLYTTLLWMGMGVAMRAREPFGVFLASGFVSLLFWHLFINVCGVLGMIPLTGVPLPFLSYGGSSTVAFLIGIGLLFNIHMRRFMF